MHSKIRAAAAFLIISSSCAAMAVPLAPVSAQSTDTSAAGTWTGQIFNAEWTLELKAEGGTWSGRYMSAKHNKWHDLQNVRVAGRSVSFNIESTPQLDFLLTMDEAKRTMSGRATLPSGMGIPFSATRKS